MLQCATGARKLGMLLVINWSVRLRFCAAQSAVSSSAGTLTVVPTHLKWLRRDLRASYLRQYEGEHAGRPW